MRVLFDQGTPVPLRDALPGHEVGMAFELGWSTLKNGDLLDAAERAGFNVFVTTDARLKYQQNLASRTIAIVCLQSTSWPRKQRVSGSIVSAIESSTPSTYITQKSVTCAT